jgi:hypothetical protein
MKNIKFRKIQQSTPSSSLELNLPVKFCHRLGLEKGSMVTCTITELPNGKHSLILEKLEVQPTKLVEAT